MGYMSNCHDHHHNQDRIANFCTLTKNNYCLIFIALPWDQSSVELETGSKLVRAHTASAATWTTHHTVWPTVLSTAGKLNTDPFPPHTCKTNHILSHAWAKKGVKWERREEKCGGGEEEKCPFYCNGTQFSMQIKTQQKYKMVKL